MPFAEREDSRRWKVSRGELEHGVVKLVGRYLQGQRVSRRQRLSEEHLRVEAGHVGADRDGGWDGGVTRDCPKKRAGGITVRGKPKDLDATKPLAGTDGEHDLHLTAVARRANTRDRIGVTTDEQEPGKRQECELPGKNQANGMATRGPKRIAISPAAIADVIGPLVRPPAILVAPRRVGIPAWRRVANSVDPAKPHRHPSVGQAQTATQPLRWS
jgi:hypothetical protein